MLAIALLLLRSSAPSGIHESNDQSEHLFLRGPLVLVVVEVEITPEPSEEERRAILAALAEEEAGPRPDSAWTRSLLPPRAGEADAAAP